jgi:hypothetical protein
MRMPFQSPPPDEAANQAVEQHPRFSLAVKATQVVNYAGGIGAGLSLLLFGIQYFFHTDLGLSLVLLIYLVTCVVGAMLVVLSFRGLVQHPQHGSQSNSFCRIIRS